MSNDAELAAARAGIDLGEVREMRAVSRLMQQSVEADATFDGTDSSGLITVQVNGRGVVQDVFIESGWVQAIGPSELGSALMEAFQVANIAAANASLEAFTIAVDSGGVEEQVAEVADDEAVPYLNDTYEELLARVEELTRKIERTEARVAEFQRLTSVPSRSGLLRLDLDQGTMTGVTVTDRRRATELSAEQVADEALSMFQAASPPSD